MKSIRTKLKLNNEQKTLMAQHAGYPRSCYNWGLSLWKAAVGDGYQPNYRQLRVVFTNHTKPLDPWMKKLSTASAEAGIKHQYITFCDVLYQSYEAGSYV
ncbi:MAG: helix-turn-helix domain-containing protein [Okeania sp. SIO3B3]|nr:helix-turn-helix domain-containing protein [Okeania sp. SIO3B3]